MENSGKSSEKVVLDLVEGIRLFSQLVNVEVNKIISEAQELRRSWDDEQYEQFIKFINSLSSSLITDTKELDKSANILEERVRELKKWVNIQLI